jgi:hypothetical protein
MVSLAHRLLGLTLVRLAGCPEPNPGSTVPVLEWLVFG